ncbi:DUF393 domain-containing protein [Cohnella endophytica]|uniref:DUF393 domain-containing protein n=1 Tax=Cohnella endophytica TaxID=2419778 RepID=A0A494Y551_9BACL|nr:DCC1-like thiol-disulfide oxidoreductase family protein [Cohnella endophytica]RKP55436.1 DUF393 domain-containing protein [Cohnella endophytica]
MARSTGDADSEIKKQRTDGSYAPNALTAKELSGQSALLLIDGVCNLCQGIARFIIARDPEAKFRFASLQSDIGQRLLQEGGMAVQNMDTFVMIDNGRFYTKSSAALKVVRRLGGLWPLLYALIVVPPFLRNGVYGFVAKRRYRWFGKEDSCILPTPDIRRRFIDGSWGAAKGE